MLLLVNLRKTTLKDSCGSGESGKMADKWGAVKDIPNANPIIKATGN